MIIITRPSPYGEELLNCLKHAGLSARHIPLFTIEPSISINNLQGKLDTLSEHDMVIAVSPQVINCLEQSAEPIQFPMALNYAAIGQKTAQLLQKKIGQTVIYPSMDENSEALLTLSALQKVAGKRILILRGNNGRELLASILQSRGAQVEYVECYQRRHIDYPAKEIQSWPKRATITMTNIDSLLRLNELVTPSQRSLSKLVVTSPRIANKARQLGWLNVIQVDSANNQILFKMLVTLCHNGRV
ncbi:uroporphyrinogen-III synthase [Utexia brackfieldae]|uniref:uroporphyrinogen-III synthase n=1 Tax=Utexia brackfieldae TaxID=3074108 RepID=UPI00370D7177